jgi:hypothetical protein
LVVELILIETYFSFDQRHLSIVSDTVHAGLYMGTTDEGPERATQWSWSHAQAWMLVDIDC